MNKFFKDVLILLTVMVVVTLMSGCTSIQIPDNVQVIEVESQSEYPLSMQKWQAYTLLMDGGAIIYTIKDNDCLLAHELIHAKRGKPGHDGFPDYLMRCKV